MQPTAEDLDMPHTGLPADVIPLQYHVPMLLDQHRMDAFQEAIAGVVRPGMHVLDLGTGTGVLSYFAARQGARVTAVEREPIVLAAARTALADTGADQITLVHADARDYVPSEPVDLVICEMMHVGHLRERQIEVISGLKQRYRRAFDGRLPRFMPEACVQAAQPVQQDFTFHGYAVAAPQFQDPFVLQPRTAELAEPRVFQQFYYDGPLPERCTADLEFTVSRPGWLNAVRIVTKNILAAHLVPPSTVDWLMNYLVVPIAAPVFGHEGDQIRVTFDYRPGDQIHVLAASVTGTVIDRR
jgi:protein arginine N-methyltransferase 1